MEHKTAKENMATMNKKEKIKYIWCYFKVHIIIGLILIIGLSSFIYTKVTTKKVYCNVTYIGNTMTDNSFESLKDPLNNALLKNDTKSSFYINCEYMDTDTSSANADMREKITAEIAARDMDIAIVSRGFFNSNLKQDIFLDLNSLPGFSSLKLSDDDIVKAEQSDNKECNYGISVKNLKVLNSVNFNKDEEIILVVIANAKHKDAAMKTIKYLTNN